jgi:signal transduction histidine kinase
MHDPQRRVGPGAVAGWLRSTHPYGVDVLLTGAVAVPVAMPFFGASAEVTLLGVLLNAGTVVPLIWRRLVPATVGLMVATFALLVSAHNRPGQMLQYGGLLVMYTVADLARPWQRRAFLLGIVVILPPGALLKGNSAPEFVFTLLLPLTAYLLGTLSRISRAREEALQERADQLRRKREAEAARAAAEERSRIARDMHDVLAHAVSVMMVQAEAGPVVLRKSPERAGRVFDTIAEAGRDAMVQLQRTLGVLASEADGETRAPQPTVAAIPDLVARMSGTGLRVDLRVEGRPRPLPPDTEVAAHRIVQEALTNTVRHADAGSVAVRLDWNVDDLVITVTDDGRGPDRGTATELRTGRGLIGIRERAAACGGRADAGSAPGSGFRVRARLPYVRSGAGPAGQPRAPRTGGRAPAVPR